MLINELTEEGACALVAVAESKPNQIMSLCGIKADATSVHHLGRGLGPADAVLLAFELRVNATVTELDLSRNDVGDVGAQHIVEALKDNATVTQLDLGDNYLGDVGAQHIAEALATNATLTSLNMLGNKLTEEGARALIAVAESKPNQIKSLCGITPDATSVDLYDHGLDAADAMLLAFDLRVNTTMTKLDLGGNHIGAVGMQHITEAL